MTNQRAFVAGATGFTGREVVATLRERGIATVAHVRAESSRRAEWTARFEAQGAEVDASVDYGLTKLLIDAAEALELAPRFVYLSSVGAAPGTRNPYLAARAKVEAALEASQLPYFCAQPSFISGPGRDDSRPGERVGSLIGDLALGTLGLFGAKGTQARYASTTPAILARARVRLGCEGGSPRRVVAGGELR